MSKRTPNLIQLPLFDSIEIKLTQGYTTIIDPIDADLVQDKWFCHVIRDRGYAKRNAHGKVIGMHNVICERAIGRKLRHGEEVDHINGDPLDNRRSNLRTATRAQNASNHGKYASNTSGYKGVYFSKWGQKWCASIGVNKKRIFLGYFNTPEEAFAAYSGAAKKLHGEFACF